MTVLRVPQSVSKILRPKPRIPVTEWGRLHFQIQEKGAVNPGPYDPRLTPYFREPLDCFDDPGVRRMNWVVCPQGGKTKAAEVGVCCRMDRRPTNMIYVRPTEPDLVEGFRDRWRPIFEMNLPHLVPMSGEWCVLTNNPRIELRSAIMYGAAASIARHATSRTAPMVMYDEVDTADDANSTLGNTLDVMDDRQMAVAEALAFTVGMSSAKFETGSNWTAYDERSDRREYWEPCPECGAYQRLPAEEGQFEERFTLSTKERDPDVIREERLARFVCEGCGVELEDRWQGWMSCRGVWVPRGARIKERLPLDDVEVVDRARSYLPAVDLETGDALRWEPKIEGLGKPSRHRGYRVWAANLNPEGLNEQRSWSHMLAKWFEVMQTRDPEKVQVFVNSWKSLPWKHTLRGLDEKQIRQRMGAHERGKVPAAAKVLFAGVDVQEAGYLDYDVWAFGPGHKGGPARQWTVEHGTLEVSGEDYQAALSRLHERFMRGWPVVASPMWRMRVYQYGVDSGAVTGDVYEASRSCGFLPMKGTDNANYVVQPSTVEGKLRPEPITFFWVNRMVVNGRLQRMLMAPPEVAMGGYDAGGGWWMHEGTEDEYIRQLASEELRHKKGRKKPVWEKKSEGRKNEKWDTAAYILAVAEALSQLGEVDVWSLVEDDPRLNVFRVDGGEDTPEVAVDDDGGGGWVPSSEGWNGAH